MFNHINLPSGCFFFPLFFHSKFTLAHCDISLCAGKSEIKVVFSFDELNPKTATRVIKIKYVVVKLSSNVKQDL